MSTATDVATCELPPAPVIRDAEPGDHPAMREVIRAAYREHRAALPSCVYRRYLADLLDLDRHARRGQLLVVEVDGDIRGSGAFYPDTGSQDMGWPPGWAGGRGLAVSPLARGRGAARALLTECERRARLVGAPVFAFHTAGFMTDAVALYERMGYRRATEFDLDLNAHFGLAGGSAPITAIAYRRDLR